MGFTHFKTNDTLTEMVSKMILGLPMKQVQNGIKNMNMKPIQMKNTKNMKNTAGSSKGIVISSASSPNKSKENGNGQKLFDEKKPVENSMSLFKPKDKIEEFELKTLDFLNDAVFKYNGNLDVFIKIL